MKEHHSDYSQNHVINKAVMPTGLSVVLPIYLMALTHVTHTLPSIPSNSPPKKPAAAAAEGG